MAKYFSIISLALFLSYVPLTASSIPALKIDSLASLSHIIVIGKVTNLEIIDDTYERGYQLHEATVKIVSSLKGTIELRSFVLPLRLGGMKGFDRSLQPGDIGVFFLSYIKDGRGELSYPQAIAMLEKTFFF